MKRFRKLMGLILLTAFLLTPTMTSFASLPNNYPTTLYVNFARIGDADSILIGKNNEYMLVDTGTYADANEIIQMLDNCNVTKLKALVITHFDSDHIGSYLKVIDYMMTKKSASNPNPIEHIYARKYGTYELNILNKYDSTYLVYRNYIKFINGLLRYQGRSSEEFDIETQDANKKYILPSTYDVAVMGNNLFGTGNNNNLWIYPTRTNSIADFTLDNTVQIEWLNKYGTYLVDDLSTIAAHVNNDSLIFKLSYLGKSMMFVGDASVSAFNDLLTNTPTRLDCDILKVSHHGRYGSSPQNFINAVTPTYSIATTTLNAAPNNPTSTITKRLQELTTRRSGFGALYYTGDVSNDYCTIAIRQANPIIYLQDTSLSQYN